ncbi:unnamed protein product [Phytophthora fragariaefolia]|uniref:Unnamed protein product n=1 Tax=Phytophthora fragariaefolia TaxID=1490495 RepID=A0A9W6TIV2_9STRA|nr:unnamed protein product [Phytophthora fragariaefolia]
MASAMRSPLLSVDLVLRSRQDTAALQDVGLIVADFLGPDRNLSLHDACNTGSLGLLEWIWCTSHECSNGDASTWSLASCLLSNCHYYKWQFSEALEVAAERGDVEVVKWIFEHFNGCEVVVEVVEAAARGGHLDVLQFLLENGGEQLGVAGVGYAPSGRHVVRWGGRSLVDAVENGHRKVAQWLYQHAPHRHDEAEVTNAIKAALRVGDLKLAEFLLPRGRCVLDYADFCSHPDVIEWKLDCGYYRRDRFSAIAAIKYLVLSGRLDLMQRIAEQHDPRPESSDWPTDWRCAMVHACVYGHRAILEWLMDHPAGRWTCNGDDRLFSELVFSAAFTGNIEVTKFLYERGTVDKVRDALLHAIRKDHFNVVKWLVEHFPTSETIPDYCVMDEAARYGRLEMLEYFQGLDSSAIPGYFPSLASPTQRAAKKLRREKYMTQMFVPASDEFLQVHATLCRYRTEWSSTEPMDDAAANGHLDVVKWLHAHRPEGCTTNAMDCAAANGYLDVVQWLHSHRPEGCTAKAIDGAAENGHLDVIRWLFDNRSEGCTPKAIEGALSNGHLRVAGWLHSRLPALKPARVELWRRPADLFELLLFRCFHFGDSVSPALVECVREILQDSSSKSNHVRIVRWLQEKFPQAPGAQQQQQPQHW